MIGHTRELVIQTTTVLEKLVKFAPDYKICNLLTKRHKGEQVIVTTLGKIMASMGGKDEIDLSGLRVFVLDEADEFFMDAKREAELNEFHSILKALPKPVQYIFFSATYDSAIAEKISLIVENAQQIVVKNEILKLENVTQYYMRCPK